MRASVRWLFKAGLWLSLTGLPTVFLEGIRWLADAPWSWDGLIARWGFVIAVLLLSYLVRPWHVGKTEGLWPPVTVWIFLVGAGIGAAYASTQATWAAWGVAGLTNALSLGLEATLVEGHSPLRRWLWRGLLASGAGGALVAIAQLESRFADEEFFVALQGATLAVFWLLLLPASRRLARRPLPKNQAGFRMDRRAVAAGAFLVLFAGALGTVRAYRHSFYPPDAPIYPGISRANPFLCGVVDPDPQIYDGEEVFRQLLALVEANPRKGPPEYGMLALGTGERRWAEAFRESLLNEVTEERYTTPAHSVKSVQYEAALRAYYYPRVREA
ncbi:MAG TPA: hypothetical protein EYH30_08775, partial [Anaerolineales bacterium]|nr:hypothetical protein [Anaerolineales bacterium]